MENDKKKLKPRTADLRPLLENGYRLLPLHPPFEKRRDRKGKLRIVGKAPIDKRWTAKTYDARKVVKTYGGTNNIGIQLRDTDLILDVDIRHNGKVGLRKLRAACPDWKFENSVRAVTGGGGLHIFLTKPADFKPVTTLPEFPGVEFKTKGTQIVAPGSVHPDTKKFYHWHTLSAPLADVQPVPKSMLKLIKRPPPPENAPDAGEVEPEQLAKMLEYLKPEDYGTNDEWLPIMFACHQATAGEGRQEFIEWSIQDRAFANNEIEIGARWDSSDANEPGGVTAGTLYKKLIAAGCPLNLIPGNNPDDVFGDEGLQEIIARLPDAPDDDIETESESESEYADDNDKGENIAGLTITRASDVEQRDYEWLWENRFALGHLHALFGLPGQGKGMLMCEIASILSRGTNWPANSGRAPKAQCVILTAEDSAKESLAPRLRAAGADLDQVLFMSATVTETKKQKAKRKKTKGKSKPATVFNIGADLKRLSQVVKKHPNVKVLFIDPIGSFIGNGKQTDSYKSAEVRAILTPITEWAERRRICVIYISHSNKSGTGHALNRMTDSQAFGAAPRFVHIVGPDPLQPDSGQKIFAPVKILTKETSALSFRIIDCEIKIDGKRATRGKIEWIGESNITANQIVASPSKEHHSATESAGLFLAELIANNGPMKKEDILAKAAGRYSERTLERAKSGLGITSKKEAGVLNGSWIWSFADTEPEAESETL